MQRGRILDKVKSVGKGHKVTFKNRQEHGGFQSRPPAEGVIASARPKLKHLSVPS